MDIQTEDVMVTNGPMSTSVMWVNPENMFDNGVAEASHYLPGGVDHWYLNRLLVKDEKRRSQGLGSHLIQRLMAELKARGAISIIVEPGGYLSDVSKLVKFYGRHGFEMRREGLEDPYFYMEWRSSSV